MPARQLVPVTAHEQLHDAAVTRTQVRIRGSVVQTSDAYKSSYRQAALVISTPVGNVRVTASPTSRLGQLPIGSRVDVATWLTGLLDLSTGTFYGERSQLLDADPAPGR